MKRFSAAQKWGFGLAILLSVANILGTMPLFFVTFPEGTATPPPLVLAFDIVLSAVTVVGVIMAWAKRNLLALRISAGLLIINMLTALPAFFVNSDPDLRNIAAGQSLVTILAVALMFAGPRSRTVLETS
jgi:CDP-diglyceride synthetase